MGSVDFLSFIHPGQLLFALTILLFGSAFTLCFLLHSKTKVVHPLKVVLSVILFLLLGTVAIEFSSASTPSYTYAEFASLSEALSTHRWLILQLPIVLTLSSIIVLSVYGTNITDRHARMYRMFVIVSTAVSFAVLLTIFFESML